MSELTVSLWSESGDRHAVTVTTDGARTAEHAHALCRAAEARTNASAEHGPRGPWRVVSYAWSQPCAG